MPSRAGEWAPVGAQNLPQIGPEILLRSAAAPSPPQTPTALLLPAPEPLSVLRLPARTAALSSPLRGSASLVSLSNTRSLPFFPAQLPVGPSPPFDSSTSSYLGQKSEISSLSPSLHTQFLRKIPSILPSKYIQNPTIPHNYFLLVQAVLHYCKNLLTGLPMPPLLFFILSSRK